MVVVVMVMVMVMMIVMMVIMMMMMINYKRYLQSLPPADVHRPHASPLQLDQIQWKRPLLNVLLVEKK